MSKPIVINIVLLLIAINMPVVIKCVPTTLLTQFKSINIAPPEIVTDAPNVMDKKSHEGSPQTTENPIVQKRGVSTKYLDSKLLRDIDDTSFMWDDNNAYYANLNSIDKRDYYPYKPLPLRMYNRYYAERRKRSNPNVPISLRDLSTNELLELLSLLEVHRNEPFGDNSNSLSDTNRIQHGSVSEPIERGWQNQLSSPNDLYDEMGYLPVSLNYQRQPSYEYGDLYPIDDYPSVYPGNKFNYVKNKRSVKRPSLTKKAFRVGGKSFNLNA